MKEMSCFQTRNPFGIWALVMLLIMLVLAGFLFLRAWEWIEESTLALHPVNVIGTEELL